MGRIIQKNIDADDGLYRSADAFGAEIRTYIKQNYNLEDYEIDFKELARQRK